MPSPREGATRFRFSAARLNYDKSGYLTICPELLVSINRTFPRRAGEESKCLQAARERARGLDSRVEWAVTFAPRAWADSFVTQNGEWWLCLVSALAAALCRGLAGRATEVRWAR
jgi:hypothetical protein